MENMVGVAVANYFVEPGKPGQSVAFDGMVYLKSGNGELRRENLVVSSEKSEGVYLANFDLEAMREYIGIRTDDLASKLPD